MLDGAITSTSPATTGNLTVVSTTSTPAFTTAGTLVLQGDTSPYVGEQITYTGKTSTTFTGITRGANLTTAASHDNSIAVTQVTTTWDGASGAWGQTNYDKHAENIVFADVTNTKIYRDNKGNTEDGTNMISYIERTGYDLDDPSMVKFVSAVYPKIEVSGSNSVNVYVGRQMSTEEGVDWNPDNGGAPYLYNPATQSRVPCRISGKYFGIKIESTTDMDWKMHGVAFEVKPKGRRGSRMM